ncbi:MAG TPA: ATP-binding protein [Candidatus Dormibacteraeota bacterium]|nr:ATP-binding protein [Candidatus Dormibacteraeota bacterium]HEX2679837.1 ATP-binding protein [Candidatus Dormibacteraeota bacterium]
MSDHEVFEFHATFSGLEEGLTTLHKSVDDLRDATGRKFGDRPLMLFETALAEIGGNVLTHGYPPGTTRPIEYELRYERGSVVAWLSDSGPPAHAHLSDPMPSHTSEAGRGIAMARKLLDELGYERDGEVNRWRLVKRL